MILGVEFICMLSERRCCHRILFYWEVLLLHDSAYWLYLHIANMGGAVTGFCFSVTGKHMREGEFESLKAIHAVSLSFVPVRHSCSSLQQLGDSKVGKVRLYKKRAKEFVINYLT